MFCLQACSQLKATKWMSRCHDKVKSIDRLCHSNLLWRSEMFSSLCAAFCFWHIDYDDDDERSHSMSIPRLLNVILMCCWFSFGSEINCPFKVLQMMIKKMTNWRFYYICFCCFMCLTNSWKKPQWKQMTFATQSSSVSHSYACSCPIAQ